MMMTSLKEKVQNGMDEARTLILGVQVLIGFQYTAVFQKAFDRLPLGTQYLRGGCLVLMLFSLMLLMAPASFHQIAEHGDDTRRVHRFTSTMLMGALMPFAIGLGIDIYTMVQVVLGRPTAVALSTFLVAVALFFWYGLEALNATIREPLLEHGDMTSVDRAAGAEKTELKDRVRQVLTEARVVIPGAQALLGFQFIAMLTEEFANLPETSQYVHVVSLVMIALSTILLMAPAAYHRIVNKGENTYGFERFAGRMVLIAMVPLAIGICGDLYVVANRIFGVPTFAAVMSIAMFVLFQTLWFGLPFYIRKRAGL